MVIMARHVRFHSYTTSTYTSHLTLALVGLLQMMKGRGGASGVEAAVMTSRIFEFALFYINQHGFLKLQCVQLSLTPASF